MITIRQYKNDNAPISIMKHVTVVASHIIVVPLVFIEMIFMVLKKKGIAYHTYYRKNDIIIAILLKGDIYNAVT